MDYLSAAYRVLDEARGPLHFREITKRALSQNLISPSGLTPDATMGSRLYVDTKKEESRFERIGKGHFAIRRQPKKEEIAWRVEEINALTRRKLRNYLSSMPADKFEALISELLIAIGFEESSVQVTSYSGDGGIDVRGILNAGDVTTINAGVQVKRWRNNVQSKTVRELRGSLTTHEQGIILTTSDFSKGARAEANGIGKAPISLINGNELIELLVKHSIGVIKQRHTVDIIDEEWWSELSGSNLDDEKPLLINKAAAGSILIDLINFPLALRAVNNPEIQATLLSLKGEITFLGKRYPRPSAAGRVASGWKSCNGWKYWLFQHPLTKDWRPINELRNN